MTAYEKQTQIESRIYKAETQADWLEICRLKTELIMLQSFEQEQPSERTVWQ